MKRWEEREENRPPRRRNAKKCGVCVLVTNPGSPRGGVARKEYVATPNEARAIELKAKWARDCWEMVEVNNVTLSAHFASAPPKTTGLCVNHLRMKG